MNSALVVPPGLRQHCFGAVGVSVVLTVGILLSGCATQTTRATGSALAVVRSDSSHARAMAEQLAAEHEGDFTLLGVGQSMQPVYSPGTVVVVHPTNYFMLRAGMPVVYVNRQGHEVAHVLVEESAAGWVAQGLHNDEPDEDLVTSRNLVGVIRCAFVPDTAPFASVTSLFGSEKRMALLP